MYVYIYIYIMRWQGRGRGCWVGVCEEEARQKAGGGERERVRKQGKKTQALRDSVCVCAFFFGEEVLAVAARSTPRARDCARTRRLL